MHFARKKLKIFAHDAGSANATLGAAYFLEKDHGFEVAAFGRGPAKKIFNDWFPQWVADEDQLNFSGTDLVVTGLSGVHSKFELEMVRLAKAAGVKEIISILDKPFNFNLRFQVNGEFLSEEYFPNIIWASGLREQHIPEPLKARIVEKDNPYWAFLREAVYSNMPPPADPFISRYSGEYLFYVTDYISEQYGKTLGYDEFSLLRGFMQAVDSLTPRPPVVIKTHPAEPKEKYDHILREYSQVDLLRVKNQNLQECIYHARAIFGHLSSVFEESAILDKQVFSLRLNALNWQFPDSVGVKIITQSEDLLRAISGLPPMGIGTLNKRNGE